MSAATGSGPRVHQYGLRRRGQPPGPGQLLYRISRLRPPSPGKEAASGLADLVPAAVVSRESRPQARALIGLYYHSSLLKGCSACSQIHGSAIGRLRPITAGVLLFLAREILRLLVEAAVSAGTGSGLRSARAPLQPKPCARRGRGYLLGTRLGGRGSSSGVETPRSQHAAVGQQIEAVSRAALDHATLALHLPLAAS